ncbi:MAG: hypothetical protein HDKAJFGB_03677 [Anaerolineae bacterium]|nr:hypothetical protein [Anaerolineae bacterium]
MSQSASRTRSSNALLRRVLDFAPPLIAAVATALAFAPQFFPLPLALGLGLGLLLLYPGYLLEQLLFSTREISLTRLPVFFAFSLALWALPATLLQGLGAHWFAFRLVFVGALWALTLLVWGTRRCRTPAPAARPEWLIEGALLLLCLLAALLVVRGPRDGDDWMYLQIIQQLMASDPFQIRAASEMRYSIRFAAHVWLFAQAFLGQWLRADVVWLAREALPTLLAPLALVSFFAWGKIFFKQARAALCAVGIQFLIYATFARGDAWGLGFFERAAQDKFLVWLILLPVAFGFAWRYLHDAKFADWFAYGAVLLGALWVHPVSLYAIVLTLGGLALFNLLSRAPFPRRRWGRLLLLTLPVLLVPLLVRVATAPAIFQVTAPDVAASLRLSQGRLLFQPPNYIADPALLGHPAILFALALLIWFAPRLRTDARIQFLWGSALLPLALLFNPFTARALGEMLTPWQLWRMTWNLPVAFILTEGILTMLARRPRPFNWKTAAHAAALLIVLGGSIWLADLNLARSWKNLNSAHALDASVEDMLQRLRVVLPAPALVLLPRAMTRYAPAYTYNALVLTDNAHLREGAGGAEIDRFYNSTDAQLWEAFLRAWKIEYVVAPNDSPQINYLNARAKTFARYRNAGLTLYQLEP